TALQVSPSFIEQYVIAARAVSVKAMGRPDARPGGWTFRSGAGTQLTHVPGLPLGTRGGILADVDLPSDGEYIVDVADMATHIWGNGMEFENPLVVVVDNKVVYETVVGGEEDMKAYDQVQNGALDRVNARLKNIKFKATAGPHKIGVTFRRRTFAESDDMLQMFAKGGGQDRFYRVQSFQVRGPFNASGLSATPAATASSSASRPQRRRRRCRPHAPNGSSARSRAAPTGGRQRPKTSTSCSPTTRTAAKRAASRRACAAP